MEGKVAARLRVTWLVSLATVSLMSGLCQAGIKSEMQLSMSSLVGKDQKMNGQPFVRFSPRGLQSCAAECKRRPRCLSFNFHLATLMCELNKWGSSSQSANLQTAAGYWFSDVSQWPDNMLGPCDGATCQLTEKCVLDNNGEAVCVPTECEEAPEVDNAQLLDNVTREVGLSTSYTCNTGYVLEGSSTEITCRTDGHWTPPQFTCRDCGPAPDVPNAVKTNSQTAPGSTTTYECSVGGLVNGPAEITCGSDGTWPPATFSCVDCGPAPDVPNAVKTNSQTAPGSTTTYECSVGGLVNGPAEITCGSDGTWPPATFSCVDCGPAPDVPNAVKTSSQTAPGSTTTYECSVGGLVNGPAEITCGSDGTWPPATFSCVDCGPAPDVPNAVKTNNPTTPGSTTTYQCSQGALVDGPAEVTCGSDGTWSPDTFSCVGFQAQVSGNTGIVLSRNYPGHYVNDEDLTYTITLEQTGPQTVSMSISYNTEIFSSGTCPDYLQINGDSHKYCGTASGVSKTITVSGSTWTALFHTDYSVTKTHGFRIDYSVV